MPSSFTSWWGGTKTSDSNEEVQTPPPSVNRRPSTRSQTKKRKTMDEGSDVESDEGATLEEIAASLRTYHSQAEGRQKILKERERKAEARAQRIESLLKRILENQKKILAEIRNNEEEEEEETDEEIEEKKEAKATTPGGRRPSFGRRPWTQKEYNLVAMGLALHGRDSTALVEVLVNRNRDQINGFLKRNWNNLSRDQKQYPVRTEGERETLLEAIRSLREAESDDEEEDDRSEVSEEEDNGDIKVEKGRKINKGLWTDEERERLFKGVAIYGKTDFKTLAAIVKTRTPCQTRMYIYRRLSDEDAPN